MTQNTYVALATIQPSGSATSIVMDSIPDTYTDLVLVCNYPQNSAGSGRIFFNNDNSSGLYSQTVSYGNVAGTVAGGRETSANFYYLMDYVSSSTATSNMSIVNIMSYARTDRFKTVVEKAGASDKGNVIGVGCWRNTSAITRIDITAGGGSFTSGATITLYGIKNWGNETTPKATGGYVYSDSSYWYHAFPFTSTFTPSESITADILVVAGGGGGAHGGGGAGGVVAYTSQSLTATGYTCTVGSGGSGGPANHSARGTSGSNSQFSSLTASVGGGAGGQGAVGYSTGLSGGSGGGGAPAGGIFAGGSPTSGQGNAGGSSGAASNTYSAGGGGGAGAVGADGNSATLGSGGIGGIGLNTWASWLSVVGIGDNGYIAGGGSGGSDAGLNAGSIGGGGSGSSQLAYPGLVSTGSGGGGSSNSAGGAGASGLIIVRYAK